MPINFLSPQARQQQQMQDFLMRQGQRGMGGEPGGSNLMYGIGQDGSNPYQEAIGRFQQQQGGGNFGPYAQRAWSGAQQQGASGLYGMRGGSPLGGPMGGSSYSGGGNSGLGAGGPAMGGGRQGPPTGGQERVPPPQRPPDQGAGAPEGAQYDTPPPATQPPFQGNVPPEVLARQAAAGGGAAGGDMSDSDYNAMVESARQDRARQAAARAAAGGAGAGAGVGGGAQQPPRFNPTYEQNVTGRSNYGGPASNYNSQQFASQGTADEMARMLGGRVANANYQGMSMSAPQRLIESGNARPGDYNYRAPESFGSAGINAGLAADQIARYGSDPNSPGMQVIKRDMSNPHDYSDQYNEQGFFTGGKLIQDQQQQLQAARGYSPEEAQGMAEKIQQMRAAGASQAEMDAAAAPFNQRAQAGNQATNALRTQWQQNAFASPQDAAMQAQLGGQTRQQPPGGSMQTGGGGGFSEDMPPQRQQMPMQRPPMQQNPMQNQRGGMPQGYGGGGQQETFNSVQRSYPPQQLPPQPMGMGNQYGQQMGGMQRQMPPQGSSFQQAGMRPPQQNYLQPQQRQQMNYLQPQGMQQRPPMQQPMQRQPMGMQQGQQYPPQRPY